MLTANVGSGQRRRKIRLSPVPAARTKPSASISWSGLVYLLSAPDDPIATNVNTRATITSKTCDLAPLIGIRDLIMLMYTCSFVGDAGTSAGKRRPAYVG